jgi:beta-phosphoglucomutase family hydrolase
MLEAIIWDMDGVLVDTGCFHYQAWADTFAYYGWVYSEALFKETFGMNNADFLKNKVTADITPEKVKEISDLKENRFRQAIHGKAELLPGVEKLLKEAQRVGLRQAIASSAPPENIEVLVKELNLAPYFDAIISGSDIPGKPDPAVFLKAAKSLKTASEMCMVIEDSIAGVQAAKAAGMRCLAVETTNPAEVLQEGTWVYPTLLDLPPDFLNQLLN